MQKTPVNQIPEQPGVPWQIAFKVSIAGIHRRFLRSLITMAGVILAIAFLVYMLVTGNLTTAMVAADISELNILLQHQGIEIQTAAEGPDRLLLLLIGLSLLTCLVGITNAMLMAVSERIKEIGTLKCLGALDSFIVKTFLIESALQGVIGGMAGLVIGLVVAFMVALINYGRYVFFTFPTGPVLLSLLQSLLIGSLLSVLAAIAPAYWAARKEPVDAMRVEE